jgi:hypothetical protein
MTFHPSIVSLQIVSFLITGMVLFCSFQALTIIRKWDISSGSELQLKLERRTYLISSLIALILVFQLASLFSYICTADHLHPFFVGAMCAAGTLNANAFGYPTLILKFTTSFLAAIWLILNYADNRAYDYPLTRIKYAFLLSIAPFILLEGALQSAFFSHLKPEIITSCCGSIFGSNLSPVEHGITIPTVSPLFVCFSTALAVSIGSGVFFLRNNKGACLFTFANIVYFLLSIFVLIFILSIYMYELPTHHCPFCILQKDYFYSGYFLYSAILTGGIAGIGVGILSPFKKKTSLAAIIPSIQKKMTTASLTASLGYYACAVYIMTTSNLILD